MRRIPDDGFFFCTNIEALLDASLQEVSTAQFRGVHLSCRVWEALVHGCAATVEERNQNVRAFSRRPRLLELLGERVEEVEALLDANPQDLKGKKFHGKPLSDEVLKVLRETMPLTEQEWRNLRRKHLEKALEEDRADWNRAKTSPEARAAWEEVEKSRRLMSEEEVKEFQARSARGCVGRVYHAVTKEGLWEVGRLPTGGTAEERARMEARAEAIVEAAPLLRATKSARGGAAGRGTDKSPIVPFIRQIVRLGVKPTAEAIQGFVRIFEEAHEKSELEPPTSIEENVHRIAGEANAKLNRPLDLRKGKLRLDEAGPAPTITYWLKGGKGPRSIGDHHLRTRILRKIQSVSPHK